MVSRPIKDPESLELQPPDLEIMVLRIHYRCSEAMTLPRWKGALFRGGLGRALKQTFCDRACIAGAACVRTVSCPYATIFAPEQDQSMARSLNGVRDVPRPFVVRPPLHEQMAFVVGDILTFDVVVIGSAAAYVQHLIGAFTNLGAMGLGQERKHATITLVEQVHPLTKAVHTVLEHGVLYAPTPTCSSASVFAVAPYLPTTLHLHMLTPTRVKHAGEFARIPECHVLIRALLRRLSQLSEHFGAGRWEVPVKDLIAQAEAVHMQEVNTQWVDWGRTSGATGLHMQLGGIIGRVTYTNVSPAIRAMLLLGSLVHVGKATVFGHGWYRLTG